MASWKVLEKSENFCNQESGNADPWPRALSYSLRLQRLIIAPTMLSPLRLPPADFEFAKGTRHPFI